MLLAAALLGVAGCTSADRSGTSSLAGVTVPNQPLPQIRRAATEVFAGAGYQTVQSAGAEMVFEKKASGWRNLAYGDWSSSSVWIRVRVSIGPALNAGRQLQCDASQVVGHGDARFEEEKALGRSHAAACSKLLEQIRQKLLAPE